MKQAFIYSLKVWLTTSIIAPVLIMLLRFVWLRNYLLSVHTDRFETYRQFHRLLLKSLGMVVADLILLIPLAVGFYYTIVFLGKRRVPFYRYKRYLSIVGVIFALLPNALLSVYIMVLNVGDADLQRLEIRALCVNSSLYVFVAIAGIWFHRFKPAINEATGVVNKV